MLIDSISNLAADLVAQAGFTGAQGKNAIMLVIPLPDVNAARPATAAMPEMVVEDGIEEETVSVIAATIAAMMENGKEAVKYAISSIKRSADRRSVWSLAGMQENTKSFV